MPPIKLPELQFPELVKYRSIKRIVTQQGTLGLYIDFTQLSECIGCFIKIGVYTPATSMGYLNLYQSGDVSIIDQVDFLISDTLMNTLAFLDWKPYQLTSDYALCLVTLIWHLNKLGLDVFPKSTDIELKIGKTYLSRSGRKVDITGQLNENDEAYKNRYRFFGSPSGAAGRYWFYTENGLVDANDLSGNPDDLIKEVE